MTDMPSFDSASEIKGSETKAPSIVGYLIIAREPDAMRRDFLWKRQGRLLGAENGLEMLVASAFWPFPTSLRPRRVALIAAPEGITRRQSADGIPRANPLTRRAP
jgi:hypothetical protein